MLGCEPVVGHVDRAPEKGREPGGDGEILRRAALDIAAAEEIQECLVLAELGRRETLDANAGNFLVAQLNAQGLAQRLSHMCISRETLPAPLGYARWRQIEAFRQRCAVDEVSGLLADGGWCSVAAVGHDKYFLAIDGV